MKKTMLATIMRSFPAHPGLASALFTLSFVALTAWTSPFGLNDPVTGTDIGNAPTEAAYRYSIDLVNIEDDKVLVELQVPVMKKNKATFYMPRIIPGTYTVYDFGRFISGFEALDHEGQVIEVEHPEVNTWVIQDARKLHRIRYRVDDSFDATGGKAVAGMSGTNIEAGKNVLINAHGFFGYFDGMKFMPFEITVKRPDYFAHQSAYTEVQTEQGQDRFTAPDYHYLVDMPVMYCRPDTSLIRLGDTEVMIAVYSPNGSIHSASMKPAFTELLHSQRDYLDGKLPVERYAFLMYFMGEQLPIGTGALEHSYSSVYCLPEIPFEQISSSLIHIASHEFFHIITPLNVHSREIHYFDFNDPDMSRHLWMYEGVTEYFSHHNQVRSGMISQEEFLRRMGQKIQLSQSHYDDHLAFTELSEDCLDEHARQYGNVYEKGALIAMCMDIELHRLSDGSYGLVDLMSDLSKKFGNERPFRDKRLFREIEKLSYPEIGRFLHTHVAGNVPIPYGAFFSRMGLNYIAPRDTMVFSLGDVQLGFNQDTRRLVVANTYSMNELGHTMGYRVGDEFISINGRSVPSSGLQSFIEDIRSDMVEGEMLRVSVARKDESGMEQEVLLEAPARKVKRVMDPRIAENKEASPYQKALRRIWMEG